jgi:hypothetical protein
VPETPEELWARTHDALRAPPVADWDTWPFEGDVTPRLLAPPEARDTPRQGEGGVDCSACAADDAAYLWVTDNWRLRSFSRDDVLLPLPEQVWRENIELLRAALDA